MTEWPCFTPFWSCRDRSAQSRSIWMLLWYVWNAYHRFPILLHTLSDIKRIRFSSFVEYLANRSLEWALTSKHVLSSRNRSRNNLENRGRLRLFWRVTNMQPGHMPIRDWMEKCVWTCSVITIFQLLLFLEDLAVRGQGSIVSHEPSTSPGINLCPSMELSRNRVRLCATINCSLTLLHMPRTELPIETFLWVVAWAVGGTTTWFWIHQKLANLRMSWLSPRRVTVSTAPRCAWANRTNRCPKMVQLAFAFSHLAIIAKRPLQMLLDRYASNLELSSLITNRFDSRDFPLLMVNAH